MSTIGFSHCTVATTLLLHDHWVQLVLLSELATCMICWTVERTHPAMNERSQLLSRHLTSASVVFCSRCHVQWQLQHLALDPVHCQIFPTSTALARICFALVIRAGRHSAAALPLAARTRSNQPPSQVAEAGGLVGRRWRGGGPFHAAVWAAGCPGYILVR